MNRNGANHRNGRKLPRGTPGFQGQLAHRSITALIMLSDVKIDITNPELTVLNSECTSWPLVSSEADVYAKD